VIVGLTVPVAGVVTGLALNTALVFDESPLTLRVTELDTSPIAPRVTVYVPLDLRFTERDDGDAEMVKSAAAAETTTVRVVECVKVGVVVVPVTVIGYDPAGVVVPRPIFRLLLGMLGVTGEVPKVQVIAFAPQAPPGVRVTALVSPFNQVTVTVPLELPPVPCVNFSGEADSVMLKSGVLAQLLNLKEPIAVAQPMLLETG
jgi:hypothetical protein